MLPPVLKAIVFTGTLGFAAADGGVFWPLLFFVSSLYSYFRSLFEWRTFLYSFIILAVYSLGIASYLANASFGAQGVSAGLLSWLAAALFGSLFFLLVGIKEFTFLRRQPLFNFLIGALYLAVTVTFFTADKAEGPAFFGAFFAAFLALWGLIKESTDFFMEDAPKRKKNLLTVGSAVLAGELLGVVSLLPIGFLASAALVVLSIFVLEDLIHAHLKGTLSRQLVMTNAVVLAIAIAFIFLTSKLTL